MESLILSQTSNRYHGSGNSFLIFEDVVPGNPVELCKCGVDGVLLLKGDRYIIYNADGSEAEMCGNGVRCIVRYLEDRGRRQELYKFQTLAGEVEAWHEDDLIGVKMPKPLFEGTQIIKDQVVADLYRVGVPHMVLFFEEIEPLDLAAWSEPFVKNFNVNFVQVHPDSISVRTFERGVNRETLSCGTGATAAAAAAKRRFDLPLPVTVHTASKSSLIIRIMDDRTEMIGPALSITVN